MSDTFAFKLRAALIAVGDGVGEGDGAGVGKGDCAGVGVGVSADFKEKTTEPFDCLLRVTVDACSSNLSALTTTRYVPGVQPGLE